MPLLHFLCPFAFFPLLLESFSFTFYNFLLLLIFSDPILLINIYHYNPSLLFLFPFASHSHLSVYPPSPCLLPVSLGLLLTPHFFQVLRQLLASVCCLLTG